MQLRIEKLFILCLCCLLSTGAAENKGIHDHGFWYGEDVVNEHAFDGDLCRGLVQFFQNEGVQSVYDFGCGTGAYTRELLHNNIYCEGYDGNPDTYKISGGIAQIIDLSQPFDLDKPFDWVLSLEVGEHLPKQFERTFIENLHRHNIKGIVLSWAVKGQPGYGHFNTQNNDYIKAIFEYLGYTNDVAAENALRKQASLCWFKHTIMVFRKK